MARHPNRADAAKAEAQPAHVEPVEAVQEADAGLHDAVSSAALRALADGDYHSHAALHGLEALLGEVRYRAAGLKAHLPDHADLLDRILSAV